MNKINPTAAIRDGWKCAKQHFIVSLGLVLAYMAVCGLMGFLPSTGFMGMVCGLLSFVVSMIWTLGIVRLSIDVVDGEEPRFGVFSDVIPFLINFLLMSVIMLIFIIVPLLLIVAVGAVACSVSVTTLMSGHVSALSAIWLWLVVAFIPAIYVSIRFFFAPYLLVDRGVGPVEALKMSWKATDPIQLKMLLFLVLSFVVVVLGFICFIVGLFVSMIVLYYAQASLYRQAFPAGLQDPLLVEDKNMVVE